MSCVGEAMPEGCQLQGVQTSNQSLLYAKLSFAKLRLTFVLLSIYGRVHHTQFYSKVSLWLSTLMYVVATILYRVPGVSDVDLTYCTAMV